jgi:altronate dehydratase
MANIFDFLVPVVDAQTLDTISQPTFGTIDVGTQGGAVSTVLLSSTSTATQVGQKFKVSVEIKTNDNQINQYKILIDFDSAKLSVVDQDSATLGTQVKLLDTIFTIANPQSNNSVSNTGRITLIANTSSGSGN